MIFSDTTFLILLCFIICINFFLNKNEKIYSIILFSLFILYTNHPKSFLAALIFISIFGLYFLIDKFVNLKKIYVIFFLILFLIYYKYIGDGFDFFNTKNTDIFIPLGVSFYTFQGIIYVQENNLNNLKKHFRNFLIYIFFFPQLIAGPICKFNYIIVQIPKFFKFKLENISFFFIFFLLGVAKKVILADNIRDYIFEINSIYKADLFLYTYVFILFYVQIFFDFSGYMNMARGLGRLFNINLPLNFKSPYLSKSPSDFFNRWHITLSNFIKEYVYLNLTRYLISLKINLNYSVLLSAFISLLVFGIWHGFNIFFIFYSFVLFLAFIFWNYFSIDEKLNKYLSIILTQLLIIFAFGFVFLGLEGQLKNDSDLSFIKYFSIKDFYIFILSYSACIVYQIIDELVRNSIHFKKMFVKSMKQFSFFIVSIFFALIIFVLSIKLTNLSNLISEKGFIYFNF